jgi:exopolysaccharide production protein ExoY
MSHSQTAPLDVASFGPSAHTRSIPSATLAVIGSEGLDRPSAASFSRRPSQASKPCGGALKRAADIVIAAAALIALLPVMLIIGALIKLTSGGSVFYAHSRVGFGGKTFPCLKFRSMVENSEAVLQRHLKMDPAAKLEWTVTQKLRNDPRISPVGKILRKTSLDELPQLYNVLMGDMSCVGPRPITSSELKRYGKRAKDYLSARPGMTGLWQVSGRSRLSYSRRVALDSTYVRRWTLRRDIAIMLRTIPAVLKSDGAR